VSSEDENQGKNAGGSRAGAGRKRIGETRKLSLTLPAAYWAEIDRRCTNSDYSISEVLRAIVEDYLQEADLLDISP